MGADRGAKRRVLAIAVAGALVALAFAPLRHLSADEAYYLCAARDRWPIPDHPPLLGVLLTVAGALPGPIELRVRLVSIALGLVTTLGLARLAAVGSDHPERAATTGAVLGAFGLLPMAGALVTTPDAPLLAALAWLLVVVAAGRAETRPILAGPLAFAATLAKVSALAITIPLALDLVRRRDTRTTAHTIGLGTLAALPFARSSLTLQLAHVAGHGEAVSAPEVGAIAAIAALLVGQLLLYGPFVVAFAIRRAPSPIPRGAWAGAAVLAAAAVASAIVSGRPPEPNWLAPAGLLVVARSARALATSTTRVRALVLASAVAPTAVALALWAFPKPLLPAGRDPLAKLAPRSSSPLAAAGAPDAPRYARPALRCVYDRACNEIRIIFMRYGSR